MKDYIALVTVELHKFARQIALTLAIEPARSSCEIQGAERHLHTVWSAILAHGFPAW
jgi:hypothetical protein